MLLVDVERKKTVRRDVSATGAVDAALKLHMEFKTYEQDLFSPSNILFLLCGPFAHPQLPGSNRGVAVFRSPLTGSLFTSTAGGLGLYIAKTGEEGIGIVGRAKEPTVITIRGDGPEVEVQTFELSGLDELYEENGVYSLINFLSEELEAVYGGKEFRIVAVGPAAFHTRYASLVSVDPKMRVPDFFGRGGAGSVLAQAHNVVAVAFGGDAESNVDVDRIKKIAEEISGKDFLATVTSATTKYRLDPKENIGGTMLNWAHLKTTLPAYNWNMIYMSPEERERLWEEHIKPTVERMRTLFKSGEMKSKTCGEICAAVCKKVYKTKIDYEPITALGSQLGIFELDNILPLTERADALGFDAIQLGNTISWALEARDRGELKLDIPPTRLKPFDVDEEAQRDAVLELMEGIAHGVFPLGDGIRRAADEKTKHYAVYVPFSGGGEIVPPQYWVPGFLVPLPLHGKFMTYYKAEWLEPSAFGEKVWKRFVRELMLENAGFCRFHRKWAEETLVRAYSELYGINILLEMERLATDVSRYNKLANAESQPPETERARDLIRTFARLFDEAWAKKLEGEGIDAYFQEVKSAILSARLGELREHA